MKSPSLVQESGTIRTPGRLNRWDLLWIAAVLVLMAVYGYVRGRHRIFWGDEVVAFLVFKQKSFAAMMRAWNAGVDSGSLFYVVFGRLWLQLFSFSEASLRSFSATWLAVSFVVLWITARRFYSTAIVGACLPIIYFLNETLRWQLYNGRMYGGFMAATALMVYAFVRAAPGRTLTRRILALTFFAHLFLVSSHILGILYSGVFVAGLLLQDLWARQFRARLYLCAMASWSILVFAFSNVRNNTVGLAKYGYFTLTPHFFDLIKGTVVYSKWTIYLLAALFVAAVLTSLVSRQRSADTSARRPVYFVLLSFAGILLTSFVVSHVATSIFYDRYLLPICLGDALLMCELLDRIVAGLPRSEGLSRVAVAVSIALFLGLYAHVLPTPYPLPELDFTGGLVKKTSPGVPLVVTDTALFWQMMLYQSKHAILATPLDWKLDLDPDAGHNKALGTEFMQRFKDHDLFADQILSSQQILERYPQFVVVNAPGYDLWFRHYVRGNPKYEVVDEGTYHGDNVWLVRTRATSAGIGGSVASTR
jgi:hypothetical protein